MYCRLFIDPPSTGAWNMAVDETLLNSAAANGHLSLRFYHWQEPTLSLGYFQQYGDRRHHAVSRDCAVVRRATGGGAILHDQEITYSIAIPPSHPLAVKHLALYETIHTVLIEILDFFGIQASLSKGEGRERDRVQPFLCFQRRSPGDVILGDHKIAGSAQRRYRGAILQHGSLLLSRSSKAPELSGLTEIAGKSLSSEQFIELWIAKLAEIYTMEYHPGVLSDTEQKQAEEFNRDKYDSQAWTQHRGRPHFEKNTD